MFLKPRARALTCWMMLLSHSRIAFVYGRSKFVPAPAELSGEGLHRFQPGTHHPRAQRLEPRLRLHPAGAVGVDVLQGLAHPARPCGLQPLFRQIALDLQLRIRQARLVPEPHVLRVPQHRPVPGLGLPDLVDGLVGVLDDVELVDDPMHVGQVLADALVFRQIEVDAFST